MRIIKRRQQKHIESDTCGLLLEVINKRNFPFGIVLSEDIRSTEPHYHKESKKCYWLLEGLMSMLS